LLIAGAIGTALAGTAHAGNLTDYDLASLCEQATAVVMADEVAHPPGAYSWETTTVYRVTKVYSGPLAVGDTVTLDDDSYSLSGGDMSPGTSFGSDGVPPRETRDILFLEPGSKPDVGPTPPWDLVMSGRRLIAGGRVYRFEQFSNPGPYEPVPQGPDPKVEQGRAPDDGVALSIKQFETALSRAMARAAKAKTALAMPSGAARVTRLLELLPPPVRFPEPLLYSPPWGNYADGLDEDLVQGVLDDPAAGPAQAADALSRDVLGGFEQWDQMDYFEDAAGAKHLSDFITLAEDSSQPTTIRVAIIRTLEGSVGLDDPDPTTIDTALMALVGDSDSEVRRAAATALAEDAGNDRSAGGKAALQARAAAEKDPWVQHALAQAFEYMEVPIPSALAGPALVTLPVVDPVEKDRLDVGFAILPLDVEVPSATIEITDPAGSTRSLPADAQQATDGTYLAEVTLSTALPSGRYDVRAQVTLSGGKTLAATNTISIAVP
jgi:hypothetical protein